MEGHPIREEAVAAAAAGVGLLFMLERQAGWLVDWETYAVLLGAIGLINLALAPGSPRDARPSPG